MTNIAKLFSAYLEATGETDPKVISETLDVPLRTIYRWLESAKSGNPSARIGKSARTGTPEMAKPVPEMAPGASRAHAGITSHANNESPSEIVKLVASSAQAREIDGLKGSTAKYVGWLAGWLSEFAPDHEAAFGILESNVELYGADKVVAGMVELQTAIAGGDKPRNPVKAFSGFIKNASTEPRKIPPAKKPHWQRTQDENHSAFLEAVERELEAAA